MFNLDINVTIHAPELSAALVKLADALSITPGTPTASKPPAQPAQTAAQMRSADKPTATQPVQAPVSKPVQPAQKAAAQPVQMTLPGTAPTAPATSLTFARLQAAASVLVRGGRQQELRDLLEKKYHLQALTQLAETQYEAFAADLRNLGVNF